MTATTIKAGDTGTFYQRSHMTQALEAIKATVGHVWSDTFVNLVTESGHAPTSVFVHRGPLDAPGAPSSYFFMPDPMPAAVDPIESEIQAKGLTAPRVTPDQIDALMARVTYQGGRVGDTTSTVVHAFLDGDFMLATGHSACVSASNFDAEVGTKIATREAEALARKQLWVLEGYALRKRLHADQA